MKVRGHRMSTDAKQLVSNCTYCDRPRVNTFIYELRTVCGMHVRKRPRVARPKWDKLMDAVSSTALLGNWAGGATGSLSQSLPGQPCQGPSPGSSSPATWLSEQGPVPPLRPLLLAYGSGTGRPQLALCALIASLPASELLTYTPRTNSAIPPHTFAHTHMMTCPHALSYTWLMSCLVLPWDWEKQQGNMIQ